MLVAPTASSFTAVKRVKGRAKARPSSRLLVGRALLLALTLGGCRSPLDKEEASPERRPELGEPATQLPVTDAPASTDTSELATDASTTTARQGQAATSGQPTTTTQPAVAPTSETERPLSTITDAGGTSGSAPGYADLRTVTYIDAGVNVKVVVDVAAPLPAFKTREVLGIGVDIYRTSEQESDYQLFADGGINGWHAYLQTPDGFIEYPGTFAVGTTRLQFEVPWSSVGGERSFRTAVFADWSSRENLLPQSGGDRAPDQGFVDVSTS